MHIITTARLKAFYEKNPDAKANLEYWNKITRTTQWQNFAEVRQTFSSASQVRNLTIFNIGGNKYRLITYIDYQTNKVFIRHVLTHAEYDTGKWKNDPWFQ
jgi:mRNA interferase HigB